MKENLRLDIGNEDRQREREIRKSNESFEEENGRSLLAGEEGD